MKSNFDKNPLYCKLAEIITDQIDSGEIKKGQMIPSERELCSLYNMSRITVRNAIDELVRQGKVEKIQGKGTYVLSRSIIQNLGNVYSFSKEMEKQGKISSTIVVERKVIKSEGTISKNLGVDDGTDIILLKRLRCAENVPIMIEKTYFFYDQFKFLLEIEFNENGLYKTLEEDYGLKIDRAIETFKSTELNIEECKMLNCPKKQYGLIVKRTSYSSNKLVSYSTIISKGDSFEFTIQLKS